MRRVLRSRVVVLIAALGLVVAASACVRSERSLSLSASKVCPVDALDDVDPDDRVELEVWHAINAEAKTTLEELAESYNESQDRVRVVVRSQGTTYSEVLNAYFQGISSGDLPGLLHADAKDMRVLIDTATLLPGQACFDALGVEPDVIPAVRAGLSVNDTYWPSLATVSSNILYYLRNDFEAAGLDPDAPPGTLDELTETARALKDNGVDRPLALLLADGFMEYWVQGAGYEMVNNRDGRDGLATEANFDNPATHRVLEWIKMMVDEGLAQPFSVGGVDQFLAVLARTSSMVIETSTASTTIATLLAGESVDTGGVDTPGGVDASGLDPAAGPFPGISQPGQAQIGGGSFFIPGTTPPEVQAAAWEFSQYMASAEGQRRWHFQGSYLPIVPGLDDDPEMQAFWQDDLGGQLLHVGVEQLLAIDPDKPGPSVGPKPSYTQAIEAAMGRVAFEGDDVDDVIRDTQRDLNLILQQYVEDNE